MSTHHARGVKGTLRDSGAATITSGQLRRRADSRGASVSSLFAP
ncbi:MAG: hypothetical protein ACREQ5_10890 [Candidatus Dormibacteria bacterium]